MSVILKNNAKCDLGNTYDGIQTSIDLGVGNGANFPVLVDGSGEYFYITSIDQNDEDVLEIMKVIATNGDNFDVVRAQDGTLARPGAVGDKIEMRVTQAILKEISNTNDKRQYLDEIFLCYQGSPVPSNAGEMESHNLKNAPKLLKDSQWDNYWGSRVKVLIDNTFDHVKYDDLSFPTTTDMYNWMIAHHTEVNQPSYADQTLVARPYEIVDQSIPVITRMYGMNRFFGALRGRNNYRKAAGSASNSSGMGTVCADLFNAIFGTAFTSATMDTGGIWLSSATKNLYTNPKFRRTAEYRVDMTYSTNRMVWDGANWITNKNDNYINNDTSTFRYAVLSRTMGLTTYTISNNTTVKMDAEMQNGGSVLLCIGLEDAPKNRAVAVKPMGIDCVLVDHPDFSRYDFEMLYFNYDKQNLVEVKTFSSTGDFNHTEFDPNTTKMRINSAEWLKNNIDYNSYTSKNNQYKWDTIRFRLRDKSTGKVGELSYSGIVTHTQRNLSYRQMLIQNMI